MLGSHGELPSNDVERLRESVSHLDALDQQDSAAAGLELLRLLDSLAGGAAVIVEDDLLLPQDKQTRILLEANKVTIVNGTVFHIREIASFSGSDDVIELLSEGTGYPLRAFVMRDDVVPFFGELMENRDVKQLASSLMGTIHAVYDFEGYVAWIRSEDIANQVL